MPPAPQDRRILLVTGGLVVLAGLFFASVLFFATGGGEHTPKPRPFTIGTQSGLTSEIKDGGPVYLANPFGADGFWLDLENRALVAYKLVVPGTTDCRVRWRETHHAYVDCHGDKVPTAALDRYQLTVTGQGDAKGAVVVDLRVTIPSPQSLEAPPTTG